MMYQTYEGMDIEGTVLRIEKSSIFDGDGLRTVVFLKGCPLRCKWCSTPESYQKKIQTTLDGTITYGQIMTVEDVMVEVRKDSLFYFHSGGGLSLIHISEPTRRTPISYAVFCLKKKKNKKKD